MKKKREAKGAGRRNLVTIIGWKIWTVTYAE
jgi:hypothetical protein